MKTPISFKLRITLVLATIAALLQSLALFSLLSVDTIVNYGLYRYGLQFDISWANFYQSQKSMFLISFAISIVLIVLSIAAILRFVRNNKASLILAEYIVPPSFLGINIFSIFLLTQITSIINTDLYFYGLQFSFDWYSPLSAYTMLMPVLLVLSSLIMMTISFLIYFSAREAITAKSAKNGVRNSQTQKTELISFILLTAGITGLLSALFFNSSILAFIGIGLVFWGILFMYIRKEEHKKNSIMGTAAYHQMDTIRKIVDELNFQGDPMYLPPKYFTHPETPKVYIPKNQETDLPTPQQIQNQESRVFIKQPAGMLVTPLGSELVRLFEKSLGTNLARVDVEYLQQNLAKTLIEDLEIVQNFEMETGNNQILVKIEHFSENLSENGKEAENQEFESASNSMLSSAIACALAKTTGHPVIIAIQETSNDCRKESIGFQIINEEAQKQP